MRSLLFPVALISLVVAGCRCEPPPVDKGLGEIGIIYELDGFMVSRPNGVYDFRGVAMGVTRTLKVQVKNEGGGPLDLQTLERISGDESLSIAFEPTVVGGAETLELTATFVAPTTDDVQKPYAAKFKLTASNTEPGKETAEIELKGIAVKAQCVLPDTIDFGGVAVNATETRTVHIENLTSLDEVATLGEITSASGDTSVFRYGPGWMAGPVPLVPGMGRDVSLRFSPTQPGTFSALVTLKVASHCPSSTVKLIGSGVASAVECAPVDFAFLPTGLTRTEQTTLTNYTLQDVNVTGLVASNVDFASAAQAVMVPAAKRELQNGALVLVPGTASLGVTFKPTKLGPLTGNVSGDSSLSVQPKVACQLQGQGGGPDIDLKPSGTLDFGAIPFFGTTDPFFVTRKLTIQNLGTTSMDARANLRLGMNAAAPFFRVTAKNMDSSLSEICVGVYDGSNPNPAARCANTLPPSYDPANGLPATGVSGLLDVPIRITPNAANKTMEWDVEFFSNDPDEPVVTLTVRAASVVLPPCQFQLAPANLQYGLVTPPQSRDLSFTIKNVSTVDSCLITHLGLAPGADATFSLPDGEVSQHTLMPQGALTVKVRATGSGVATSSLRLVLGAVRFGISDPLRPQNDVPLSAQIGLGCLTIAPADLDFGTVKQGCDSSSRTFTVYNTCLTPVTINGWRMSAPAGQPIGGPNCMNMSAHCAEFLLDGAPTFMAGAVIPPAAPMPGTFKLKYRPIDLGRDTGAFTLDVTQNGGSRTDMVVTLRGTGDTAGVNIDTFAQDPRPKADVLWVIDSSCSMYDKQQLLSMNFASVIQYASTVVPGGVDYQMAVIDSDPNTISGGRLRGDPPTCTTNCNPKVLRAGMTNVDALFRSKVRVGINGSGNEQFAELAVRALTAPLVNTDNAGFLRPDATLAIIAVTDAGDQSQMPFSVIDGLLRNIKGAQRPGLFSYNVIGPFSASPPPGCIYDDFTDTVLHEYLVTAFDGATGQICDQQNGFASALQQIGKKAFGYRDRFFLSSQPDLTQMPAFIVKLNGILAPPTNIGGTVWTYEPASNSLLFTATNVPEPGDVLTVEYVALCN